MRAWIPYLFAVLVLAAVPGCASPDTPRSTDRGGWGDLWPEVTLTRESNAGVPVDVSHAWPAKRPTAEQQQKLKDAEDLYRAEQTEQLAALRDELAGDPVAAFWLTRLFVYYAQQQLAALTADERTLVEDVADAWERPRRHLVALGQAAVPSVVLDLVRNREPLGREILVALGPEARPAWNGLFELDDARARRFAYDLLAEFAVDDDAERRLFEGTRDDDFGVRAVAWQGLAKVGDEYVPQMRSALSAEDDGFVVRALLEALAAHRDRPTALAIVDTLEEAIAAGDAATARAATDALEQMASGAKQPNAASWRAWAEGLPQ